MRLSGGTILHAELHWYEVSLERRKIYVALSDAEAARHGRIRLVDESGDDYLCAEERFVVAELPQATRQAVMQAA